MPHQHIGNTYSLKKGTIVWLVVAVFFVIGCEEDRERHYRADMPESVEQMDIMEIDTTSNLIIYYPKFSKIDLVCKEPPSETDENVILVCGAAFTGEKLKHFRHSNIAGNHASGGRFYQGYEANGNTGVFAYYRDKWYFSKADSTVKLVSEAADHQGMAFGQKLVIYKKEPQGVRVKGRRRFRTLCERKGRLCFIEGRRLQDFDFYVSELRRIGVRNAIYLNTGTGWNYSWYRDNNGMVHRLHPKQDQYATNWVVFYK